MKDSTKQLLASLLEVDPELDPSDYEKLVQDASDAIENGNWANEENLVDYLSNRLRKNTH